MLQTWSYWLIRLRKNNSPETFKKKLAAHVSKKPHMLKENLGLAKISLGLAT